jgi:hypothetical protein
MEDPIVEEVRRIREHHAAEFHYDIDAIFADYKRLEAESKRKHVSFGPRRIEKRIVPLEPVSETATK